MLASTALLALAFTGVEILPENVKQSLARAAKAREEGRKLSESSGIDASGLAALTALATCSETATLPADFGPKIASGDITALVPLCSSQTCIAVLTGLSGELASLSSACDVLTACPIELVAAIGSGNEPSSDVIKKACDDTCKDTIIAQFPQAAADVNKECDDAEDPCFARDTFALSPSGEAIAMASLKSGDLVMDGPSSVARVIVNQHREATFKSSLLSLEHANGELSLTPDHVLEVDGKFVPARLASAGSKLGGSEVSRVVTTAGEVINPLTTSGKILTQGGVLASTYPEWVAEYMLSSYLVPLPLSLSNLVSFLFPETTQAYYDALIEPLVTKAHPKHLKAALPAPLLPAAFLLGDLALASGFFGFALASPMVLVAAAAVAVAAKARK